jgi:AmiR/NasT family two-component response regulator
MTDEHVAQAARVVAEQAGCSVEAARRALYDTAFDTDCTVEEVAELVIRGEIRFD